MRRILPLLLAFSLVPALARADDHPALGPIRASLGTADFSFSSPPVRPAVPAVMRQTRRQALVVLGVVGGAFAGAYAGALLERGVTGCKGDLCGLRGAVIGLPVGGVFGGIVGARAGR